MKRAHILCCGLLVWSLGAAAADAGARSDQLLTAAVGPVSADPEVAKQAKAILAYIGKPDTLAFRVLLVAAEQPLTVGLPDGSIYLSTGLLDRLNRDPEQLQFLVASTAGLIVDGQSRRDETVTRLAATFSDEAPLPPMMLGAVEWSLTAERVFRADRTAMLYLARAGLPPLEAVRALDTLAAGGVRDLCATANVPTVPSLRERRLQAQRAADRLIEAATEFDFGVMDLVNKEYETAAKHFAEFLRFFPDNYAGHNNLGLCYYHLAIRTLPPQPFLLADAVAQFDTGFASRSQRHVDLVMWERARDAYLKAHELEPDRVEPPTNLASLYAVVKQWQEAKGYSEQALALDPGYAVALNNQGTILAMSGGDMAEALAHFRAAADTDPNLPEAQFNLGQARAELQVDGRETAWRRYLALAPKGDKAEFVRTALRTTGPAGGPANDPAATPGLGLADIERTLRLWNRVMLALETPGTQLITLLEPPDRQQDSAVQNVRWWGWTRHGLVVEMVDGAVNRVLAGRPPGHEATTKKGVQVGYTVNRLEQEYGDAPAVSRQAPYDIFMYPDVGLGFFVLSQEVNKIFMFEVMNVNR